MLVFVVVLALLYVFLIVVVILFFLFAYLVTMFPFVYLNYPPSLFAIEPISFTALIFTTLGVVNYAPGLFLLFILIVGNVFICYIIYVVAMTFFLFLFCFIFPPLLMQFEHYSLCHSPLCSWFPLFVILLLLYIHHTIFTILVSFFILINSFIVYFLLGLVWLWICLAMFFWSGTWNLFMPRSLFVFCHLVSFCAWAPATDFPPYHYWFCLPYYKY